MDKSDWIHLLSMIAGLLPVALGAFGIIYYRPLVFVAIAISPGMFWAINHFN